MRAIVRVAAFLVLVVVHLSGCYGDQVNAGVYTKQAFSKPINPRFAGFSWESSGVIGVMGRYPSIKPSFLQLMRNLGKFTGANPQWRIGGNSADVTWYNPNGSKRPENITYDITPSDLKSYNSAAQELATHMVLSVNFRKAEDPQWAVNHVEGIASEIGWDNVYALEIGNECDLYGNNGIRSKPWNYTFYKTQFDHYYETLVATGKTPKTPFIQGATWCCESNWLPHLGPYVDTEGPSKLRTVSYHKYPLDVCNGNKATLLELMEDNAAQGKAANLEPYVKDAIAKGVEFWMGEVNSVACGGAANVSNVMGAALWTVDYLFNFANISVEGMNFHGGAGGAYSAFTYASSAPEIPIVHPVYYAFYLFAQAIENGAKMVPVHVSSTTNNYIKVWATVGTQDESLRVVVIHKDIQTTKPAQISLKIDSDKYASTGQVYTLKAASPYSAMGLKIGNQTFDGSQSGAPIGERAGEAVHGENGGFSFSVEPSTIALLVIPLQ